MRPSPVVDTFLFSDRYEAEVLIAKLHVESPIVDHWIAVENTYSIKGEPKGACLGELLSVEPRLAPFLDRLTVLTLDRPFCRDYRPTLRQRAAARLHRLARTAGDRHHRERPFFFAEWAQRRAATETALALGDAGGWIIVSDVDELVDGTTPHRREIFHRALAAGAAVTHLPRRRFVYDFDNVSMARFRHVPVAAASAVRRGDVELATLRVDHSGLPASPEPLVFEYSYCYPPHHVHQKLATFTHLHPGERSVERALECNHALIERPDAKMKNEWWYETIGLDEARHPEYVAENLDRLKTHAVNPDYREARRRRYPQMFAPR